MGLVCEVGMRHQISHTDEFYGIEWDTTVSNPACTRIGKAELHASLPVQSLMRRCILKDDGTVNYYLAANDSTLRENGSDAKLDGSDGQFMVEIPDMYVRFEEDGNKRRVLMSQRQLSGYIFWGKCYVSAVEATIERTTSKLSSVVNSTANYRGGNNIPSWDTLSKTLLGRPASNIDLTTFRAYARNRGSVNWNCNTYQIQCRLFWLFAIEYATLNSQGTYNAALTSDGYRQGGLGNGVSTIDYSKWNAFNSNFPFVPCGYTNGCGNKTGIVTFTMPFNYDAGSKYIGEYNANTDYVVGNYVSSGTSLYVCILASSGNGVTNTTYFTPVIRKTVDVISYHGIENPFGHIWKWTDGCKCMVQSNTSGGISVFYVCGTPGQFTSSGTDNYQLRGNIPRTNGYVKDVLLGETGDIIPTSIGGGSTTYFCDYFYTSIPSSGISERGVLFGGAADASSGAGFVYANTYAAASYATAFIGSRLCYIP